MIRNVRTAVALLFTGAAFIGASSPATGGMASAEAVVSAGVSAGVSASEARTSDGFGLNFDNGESLRPGSWVRDITGHGHRATVVVSDGGRLTRVKGVRGSTAAGFPGTCGSCGRAILEIADRPALDPRRSAVRFGAAVRVTARRAPHGSDPNIVQKGLARTSGGQLKLELIGARPRCVVMGRAGGVSTARGPSVADGRWHHLACSRRGRVVALHIDGTVAAQKHGATGRIANAAPVRIGGKAVGHAGDDDQFHGRLDNVFLRITR